MDMTLRWYGEGNDSVTLDQIRQIPGVTGVITALHDIPAGEAWTYEDVMKRKQEVEAKGLKLVGVESINVHEDIKIGLPTRDELIENYCKSLEAIGKADIHLVCYNFMPVFDWTRSDLAKERPDGSTVLAYSQKEIGLCLWKMVLQRLLMIHPLLMVSMQARCLTALKRQVAAL